VTLAGSLPCLLLTVVNGYPLNPLAD
jgi:hypothetical protein